MAKIPSPASPYFFTDLPHLSAVATESKISRNDAEKVIKSKRAALWHCGIDVEGTTVMNPDDVIKVFIQKLIKNNVNN